MRKKLTYLLSFTLSLYFMQVTNAQVFTGNLTLTTQAQVDAFNYTEVTGHLMLDGSSTITRLGDLYRSGVYYVRMVQGKQHKELKLVKVN